MDEGPAEAALLKALDGYTWRAVPADRGGGVMLVFSPKMALLAIEENAAVVRAYLDEIEENDD